MTYIAAMAYLNDLQSKRKTKEDQGEEFGDREKIHCALSRNAFSPLHDSPNDDSNYARGLEGRNNCEKTLAWFSFVLKLK